MNRALFLLALCLLGSAPCAQSAPADRRARRQPSPPPGCKEIPFVETAPAPTLNAEEKARGFLLFHRPITEPVYPNTRPLPSERLRALQGFATPGEFEPLTFTIYPVRALKNLRVTVSALKGAAGEIPASGVEVRLQTYWNVGFPRYTSLKTYRRTPELLERVTVHSSPAFECQRWWLTVRVPDDAKPGVYRGAARVRDDRLAVPVVIPIAFRVLGFRLRRDPAKHYSAYYSWRNKYMFQGRRPEFIRRARDNEYKAMVEMGLDTFPTLYVGYDRKKDRLYIRGIEDLPRMRAVGLRGPLPLAGGSAVSALYHMMTPGGRGGSHWRISKMPPPAFYAKLTQLYRRLAAEAKAKGWPKLYVCPLDEPDASIKDFGGKVFKAIRDAGVSTYITKNPLAADARAYRGGVDAWCSQPYAMPYEKIIAQTRYEYWCYPNHNAGEIKDRRVMCKGGRMTYGFGFWRSGYVMLIPWHWSWVPRGPDPFDYLRSRRSGCGQRIGDDAEVIPAVYWYCFREGRDDERYIYTLQQAVWEREGSKDPACRRAVEEGKAVLQRMWDDIRVQQKYLADGMWPSEEFNARRWRLALATQALLRFPPTRRGHAPSVLVSRIQSPPHETDAEFIAKAVARGEVETKDLGGDWTQWVNVTREGKLAITPAAGRGGKPGLRWSVTVDHKVDGGEGGKYPIGWPRIYRAFAHPPLDMARYDYLMFLIRVDSDRDEVADDTTPVGFTIHSNKFYEVTRDLGGRQRVWLPVLFPVREMIATVGRGLEPWRAIRRVQFFIAERRYQDGTHLTFDLAEVKLLRFKGPMIRSVEAPAFVMLPRPRLDVNLKLMGPRPERRGAYVARAALKDAQGRPAARAEQDLAAGARLVLDVGRLAPGAYRLETTVVSARGAVVSRAERRVECLPGPFWKE